ncbi:hypothetical protein HY483_02450 [Candidatus Woesearchaeota archaeon]|nr:hypothetical protein [Candidatus Woesearchaeota archaeon]
MLLKSSRIVIICCAVLLAVFILLSLATNQNITGSASGIPKDCTASCRERSLTIEDFERCINESCSVINSEPPSSITTYVK